MKKIIALVLTALLALSLVACGSETKTDDADKTEDKTSTELTGTVSTDGSTSMEKVIGALSESFMAQNGGVTVNYNPTGSGSGITAVQEGTCCVRTRAATTLSAWATWASTMRPPPPATAPSTC